MADIPQACALCHRPVDADHFCHGCHEFICDECDPGDEDSPIGAHHVEDHRKEMRVARGQYFHG
jgi:recombinational DNA repair protein (RecF pathway)